MREDHPRATPTSSDSRSHHGHARPQRGGRGRRDRQRDRAHGLHAHHGFGRLHRRHEPRPGPRRRPGTSPLASPSSCVSGETADRCGGTGLNIYGGTPGRLERHEHRQRDGSAGRPLPVPHPRGPLAADRQHRRAARSPSSTSRRARPGSSPRTRRRTALDGIRWTPWGTVLFAEETDNGRLFELVLDKKDPMSGTTYRAAALGLLAHEGIEVGPDGAVYVIDEFRGQSAGVGGGIYRFVPDRRGDLTAGKLYALKVDGADGVGQGSWVGPIDPATARTVGHRCRWHRLRASRGPRDHRQRALRGRHRDPGPGRTAGACSPSTCRACR